MLRAATRQNTAEIDRFLALYTETSMFLRGNLAAHGIGAAHRHGTDFFLWSPGQAIEAVFGVTNGGYVMCQNPGLNEQAAEAFVAQVKHRSIAGITGDSDQVDQILRCQSFPQQSWKVSVDEPLFTLHLSRLPSEDDVDMVRSADAADRDLLISWFQQYEVDAGLSRPGPAVDARAKQSAEAAIVNDDLRLYCEGDQPVAMTAFNARVPECVQVGGVFVPRDRRNSGLARRIVTAHLHQAKAEGVDRAILFASSPQAARAYTAIGFGQIGTYRVQLAADPPRCQ